MRRLVLIILIFISRNSFSQNYVLIDRQLVWKSYCSDTITKKIVAEYFPIYKSELDSLLHKMEPLWNISKFAKDRTFLDENDYSTGHIKFKITMGEGAYGTKYDILIISRIGIDNMTMILSGVKEDVSANKKVVQNFIKQLRKTKDELSKGKINLMTL